MITIPNLYTILLIILYFYIFTSYKNITKIIHFLPVSNVYLLD